MSRTVRITLVAAFALVASVASLSAQTRPAEPPRVVAPGDEIKLDESSSLKAAANQSRLSAILANAALLQRQFQDLQTEWTKMLDERKKLIDEGAKKAKVDVRDINEWLYDEGGHRYVRKPKTP